MLMMFHAYTHIHIMQYITLIWLITYIALHDITLHYITLHYIISHYIVLHYIISHYITDTKHTLISACACSSECMYVCAFFWRCETITRSDVRISGASCLLLPERHVFFFQATCSIWGTNREACTEWPFFLHAAWFSRAMLACAL